MLPAGSAAVLRPMARDPSSQGSVSCERFPRQQQITHHKHDNGDLPGQEQIHCDCRVNKESRPQATGMVITKYEWVPYERMVVYFENGQVWRQINGDTQKIRVSLKRNQTVDITESSISGYKMQLNEMRRSVRVERIR